ncbi:autotransporter outer membrane beta-barrel domain-containing protein [Pseudaminobacter salicylatoxidans]|uniref:autotransporter outer membrane beta-barrel domain-containing protein n=1 Tax=Pseudaminobacter salicylatoxidans TaxID=93369 RepID=UPI000316952E|nr:autotransporter outer membrane beta-barrel domain-containing protein [Pseudaminobacter salicylatoxidans]
MTIGNVDLGSGENSFLNRSGATFLAFDTIRLRDGVAASRRAGVVAAAGAAHTFTNDGEFLMGLEAPRWAENLAAGYEFPNLDGEGDPRTNLLFGSRVVSEVALDGNFVQTATGHMAFDVAYGPYASDRVNVTGDAAVAGTGRINLMWLENARPVTLFATGGQGVDNGLSVPGTLALDFGIIGDENGIHLTVQSDFGREFLRPNEQRLGGHMDSALQVGDASGIGRLMAALGNMEEGQEELYKFVFNELNPEAHIAPLQTQYRTATGFSDLMLECRWSGSDAENCLWADAGTMKLDQEGTQDYWGVTSRTLSLRTGFERRLEQGWSIAGALGYNRMDRLFVDDERFHAQGNGFDIGIGARREFASGVDVSFTATGGWQWYETTRSVNVFEPATGTAKGNSGYGQLSGEIGYTAEAESLTLRPALAFTGTALHTGSFAEYGLGGLGARMSSHTQYIGEFEPKLSLGYRFDAGDGVEGILALSGGWAYRSTNRIETPISFVGASTKAEPAMISTPLDRSNWKIGASAELHGLSGWSLEAGYKGQLGGYTDVHSGSVSLRWKF